MFHNFNYLNFFFCSDTQQADYHVTSSVTYRGNGAVASLCLAQYADLMSQYYGNLNEELSKKCSAAVNVFINVTFSDTKPKLVDDNVVQVC